MMDYSKLVKRLREHNGWALNETLDAAADAIEELQAAVEREKTYTQFWQDAAETCKVQYEKMQRERQLAEFDADNWRDAYHCWFENYQNDVPKWIPVTERLPDDREMVIGFTPCDGFMFVGFHVTSIYHDRDFSCWNIVTAMRSTRKMTKKVTHWTPLPEPPKEETE